MCNQPQVEAIGRELSKSAVRVACLAVSSRFSLREPEPCETTMKWTPRQGPFDLQEEAITGGCMIAWLAGLLSCDSIAMM